MAIPFYSGVKDFEMFDELISQQYENPTKHLNLMLRNGVTKQQLDGFIKKRLNKFYSNWQNIKKHIRYCEKHGWLFSIDIDKFIKSEDHNLVFKIVGFSFNGPSTGKQKTKELKNLKIQKKQSDRNNDRLLRILSTVANRVKRHCDSLDPIFRFKRSGIEGWFKVEVVAALGGEILKLNNKGPDLTLIDGIDLELKAATDFNPSYLRDGALKDNVPCLFLGNGEHKQNIERLKSMVEIHVVGIEYVSGLHAWAVGCIVPAKFE